VGELELAEGRCGGYSWDEDTGFAVELFNAGHSTLGFMNMFWLRLTLSMLLISLNLGLVLTF
jgi:hypothetical protein